jgi:hypothetical protein
MAEKFYIVTEQSKLYKDYCDYKENLKITNEIAINFMKSNRVKDVLLDCEKSVTFGNKKID